MAKTSGMGLDGGKVCLFAQYDRSGRVPPHTLAYLAALAGCGFALHVACSGIAELWPEDAVALAALGAVVYPRPNLGLDFGAWRDLLAAGAAAGAQTVLLANDSVFGPFADLRPVFQAMDARTLDAWGMVESRERVWHLQSWFVCLSGAALARPAVRRVFAQDFTAMDKEEIILHGELGLGAALRAERLATGAVWQGTTRLRKLISVNPSHFDWHGMLVSGAVPFLKVELLRDNPANIAWLGAWRRVLGANEAAVIDRHLTAASGYAGAWQVPVRPAPLARLLLNILLTRDHAEALRHPWPIGRRRAGVA